MDIAVTPQQVAAAYPAAPAVTAEQIQQARDWAEPLLEAAGVVIETDSRKSRAAERAVMLYALHLAAEFGGFSLRVSKSETGVTLERKKIGELEKEVRYAAPSESAAAFGDVAGGYLAAAWTALHAAGLPRLRRVVGASR